MTEPIHNPALMPPGVGAGRPGRAPARPGRRAGPEGARVRRRPRSHGEARATSTSPSTRCSGSSGAASTSRPTLERLQAGVDRAAAKGARDSVVFVDGTAFVVSVPNRTVITAVDSEHMREHVFTNIDSAVIA